MIDVDIQSIDTTGQSVPPDPTLRERVGRAAELLKSQLAPVKTFPIRCQWRIVHQPGSDARVELDLTGWGAGIKEWLVDPADLIDDKHATRALRSPVGEFGRALSFVFRDNLEQIQRNLEKLATVAPVVVED